MGVEHLHGGYRMATRPGWGMLTTDALALAAFCRPAAGDRICDLGCGGGAVLLLLAADHSLTLHGVEVLPEAAALCRENLAQGDLPGRSRVFELDLREFSGGPYDLVTANPPYYPLGAGRESRDPLRRAARFETRGTLRDFCACAGRLLRCGGRFCLVLPAERERETPDAFRAAGLRLIRREPLGRKRVLLEARKGEA